MELPQTGGCQCGKIRYEITEVPELVTTCHCTDCQRITSSAFSLGIALPEAAFRLTQASRDRFSAWPIAGGSTPGLYAPIARAGLTACRAMGSSASGPEHSTTHHGCGRPGISGRAASSPGLSSPKATRPSRGNRPIRSAGSKLTVSAMQVSWWVELAVRPGCLDEFENKARGCLPAPPPA